MFVDIRHGHQASAADNRDLANLGESPTERLSLVACVDPGVDREAFERARAARAAFAAIRLRLLDIARFTRSDLPVHRPTTKSALGVAPIPFSRRSRTAPSRPLLRPIAASGHNTGGVGNRGHTTIR